MAFRSIAAPCRLWNNVATPASRPATRSFVGYSRDQRCGLATAVPPVTQDATGAKGPTAMVFMNMGGPSTTDQVEDFLSRLFVCFPWLSSGSKGIASVLTMIFFYLFSLTAI
jgi:ferrochelatase